jgi:hypothetical protein
MIVTSFAGILIRQAREEIHVVNDWLSVELARERNARILAEAEALRARVARKMFAIAVALEKEETWRAVWERLEAPRHP